MSESMTCRLCYGLHHSGMCKFLVFGQSPVRLEFNLNLFPRSPEFVKHRILHLEGREDEVSYWRLNTLGGKGEDLDLAKGELFSASF